MTTFKTRTKLGTDFTVCVCMRISQQFITNIPALLVFCQNFIGMKHAVVDSLVRGSYYYNVDRVVLKTG